MRKLLCALLSFASAAAVVAAKGATGDWLLRSGVGESIDSAATWADDANWRGEAVPSAVGDGAYMTNALSSPVYIKADGGFSISWLRGVAGAITDSTACPYIVSDSSVTLNASSRDPFLSGVRLYADLKAPYASGAAHFNSCLLCGDVAMNFMSVSSGTLQHRLDLYANAAGETRVDPLKITTYRNSWGAFRVYAPQSSPTSVVGQWSQTAYSPYLFRTGAKHVLSAGTLVHGAGIKSGTYLKRIFADDVIELSEAAESTVAGNELVFDAFTPNVTIHVGGIARQNTSTDNIRLMKFREEDSLRCEINSIFGGASNIAVFDTDDGYLPGTYVMTRIVSDELPRLHLGTCHFEFAPSDAGESGFPNAFAKMTSAAKMARFTVQEGVTARILGITNLVGTVVKDGAGTLKTSLHVQRSLNTGVLEVREGVLELDDDPDGGAAYVKTLAISNGAAVKLPASGLRVDTLSCEDGAVVSGGALYLPAFSAPAGLTFADGASLGVAGGAGAVVAEPPEMKVVGTPAFWVDVSDDDARTVVEENGTNFVTRLDDVRGAEYGFATNVVKRPWLVTDATGLQHVYFPQSNEAGISNACPLVWDKPIYGIRHVFLVHSPANGGGVVLGVSDMLWKRHYMSYFLRDKGNTWNSSIVWSGVDASVLNGEFYVNGELRAFSDGYPYSGTYSYGKDTHYIPLVLEATPLSGVHADCFAYEGSATGRNGRQRLCECIVYTNVLTQTERVAVTGYLMKKWMNAEVDWSRVRGPERNSFGEATLSDGGFGYGVAAGETGWIDSVSGCGALVKGGAGTLTVAELSDADADVVVADGTLAVASPRLTSATLPGGAYLHVDASAPDTLTTNVVDGVTRVTAWASASAGGETLNAVAASTNKAVYSATACGGKPAVDFGPRRNVGAEGVKNARPDLLLASAERYACRTAFALLDSSAGGGSLVPTCGYAYNVCVGLMRANYGLNGASDALFGNALGATGNTIDNGVGTGITRVRVNGAYIAAKSTGMSGGWDVVSLANHYAFGVAGLGSDHYSYYIGGSKISEYILYPQMLSRSTVVAVEAYLKEKWLGQETPGYRATRAKSVTVAAGATLDLRGGSIQAAGFSGSGTVNGSVALEAGSVVTLVVDEHGAVAPLAVSGGIDFSNGGTFAFVGGKPAPGVYPVAANAGETVGAWTASGLPASRVAGVFASGGQVFVRISSNGFSIILR